MHLAILQRHVHLARALLVEGALEIPNDDSVYRPVCLVEIGWAQKKTRKGAPSFHAHSWLWPTELATESVTEHPTSSGMQELGEIREGLKRAKRVPLGLCVLRHRHRRKDTMKILLT